VIKHSKQRLKRDREARVRRRRLREIEEVSARIYMREMFLDCTGLDSDGGKGKVSMPAISQQ
jgi:hypothetical protein